VFRRRQVKTHTRLAREELNESFGHLRLAAAHAADGASGAMAPRVESARKAVQPSLTKARDVTVDSMDTLLSAALDGSRRARKDAKKLARNGKKKVQKKTGLGGNKKRRWPMVLGGLVAVGAVAGAATAYVKRRQANNAWDEYDATRTTSDTHAVLDKAKSTMDAGVDKVSAAAKDVKERSSDLIGSKSTPDSPTSGVGAVGAVGVDKTSHNGRS
jgi:hypothetical protein